MLSTETNLHGTLMNVDYRCSWCENEFRPPNPLHEEETVHCPGCGMSAYPTRIEQEIPEKLEFHTRLITAETRAVV